MDLIFDAIIAVFTFIIEMTVKAFTFIFLLICASFSPRYRERLREEWNTSAWNRFEMIFGVIAYTAALLIAVFFWIPMQTQKDKPIHQPVETSRPTITIDSETTNIEELKGKAKDKIIHTAGELIKRKFRERFEKNEEQESQDNN